jgi:hypothetical protein
MARQAISPTLGIMFGHLIHHTWHPHELAQGGLIRQPNWIGWSIGVETWTIQVPQQKLAVILSQLDSSAMDSKLLVKSWEFIAGRLLWLTSAWQHLRPLSILLQSIEEHSTHHGGG